MERNLNFMLKQCENNVSKKWNLAGKSFLFDYTVVTTVSI